MRAISALVPVLLSVGMITLATDTANAADLLYSFTPNCSNCLVPSFSFDVDSSPTVAFVDPDAGHFATDVSNMVLDGKPYPTTKFPYANEVYFYTSDNTGGLDDYDGFFNFSGSQLFSGSLADPILLTGSFPLTRYSDGSAVGTLSVTLSAVPEPKTWMTILLGFGILGSVLRLRFRKSEEDVSYELRTQATA